MKVVEPLNKLFANAVNYVIFIFFRNLGPVRRLRWDYTESEDGESRCTDKGRNTR